MVSTLLFKNFIVCISLSSYLGATSYNMISYGPLPLSPFVGDVVVGSH